MAASLKVAVIVILRSPWVDWSENCRLFMNTLVRYAAAVCHLDTSRSHYCVTGTWTVWHLIVLQGIHVVVVEAAASVLQKSFTSSMEKSTVEAFCSACSPSFAV